MSSNTDLHGDLQARVDEFVADLSELIRAAALEAVREALGEPAAGAGGERRTRSTKKRSSKKRSAKKRSTKARAAKGRRRGKRSKRSAASLEKTMQQVVRALEQEPDQGVEQLSKSLGVPSADVKQPVAMLLENGVVKRKGKARGTRYALK